MVKKAILLAAIALCAAFGMGIDLDEVKQTVDYTAEDNARAMTGGVNDNWGTNSPF